MATNERSQLVFILLTGLFLSAMTLLNLIGITRFIQMGPLVVGVGTLVYPLTFLCTDLISELYGAKKARLTVWLGLGANLFVLFVLWVGQLLPTAEGAAPWQSLNIVGEVSLPTGQVLQNKVEVFDVIYACTAGSMMASMVAYSASQFCDVYLFHFWKKITRGRHLWLRNNLSTSVSQMVDSMSFVFIAFGASYIRGDMTLDDLWTLGFSNYIFKLVAALIDTGPFYLGVHYISKYIGK